MNILAAARRALFLAAATTLLAATVSALAGNTTFFSSTLGDVVFPFTAPTASAPGLIDNMTIGATTPRPITGTNVHATGTATLDGAVSGAGFQAAVKAISAAQVRVSKVVFLAPLPADLTTVVNAVTPSNVALTTAAQPPQARKLQVRIVIGTTTTTAITAGNLALVGIDQDGNAVTENISLIQNASATVKSANAYATLTSATVSAYAASGSGTGNTVGIGPSNDFGVPTGPGVTNFAIVKATKVITTVTGAVTAWSRAVTDDVATSAVVDATARTIAPTTAPGTAGINDYEFSYSYNLPQ
jgi:hypothetical protein